MADALADHVALLAVAQRWERLYKAAKVENEMLRAVLTEIAYAKTPVVFATALAKCVALAAAVDTPREGGDEA